MQGTKVPSSPSHVCARWPGQVRREMRFLLSAQTSHPHIVRGIAAFQDVTALYLVQVG